MKRKMLVTAIYLLTITGAITLAHATRSEGLGPRVSATKGKPTVLVRISKGLYQCRLGAGSGIQVKQFNCEAL